MLIALTLAIVMVDYEYDYCTPGNYNATALALLSSTNANTNTTATCQDTLWAVPGVPTKRFKMVWACSRMVYIIIYAAGGFYNKVARKMTRVYILFLSVAVVVLFISLAIDQHDAYV